MINEYRISTKVNFKPNLNLRNSVTRVMECCYRAYQCKVGVYHLSPHTLGCLLIETVYVTLAPRRI